MMKWLICFLFSFSITGVFAQNHKHLNGIVLDEKGVPLAYANVYCVTTNNTVHSGNDGRFYVSVHDKAKELEVVVSYVGKRTETLMIPEKRIDSLLRVTLREQSLKLNHIEVSGIRKARASNSSIVYTREAIDQLQAFSLADVLNNLPGKTTSAPELQNPQTLTLRSEAGGEHAMSNALGTAIIMDGVRMSNDANMQNRSLSIRGMGSSVVSSSRYGSFDVPFSGIDLREIPTDNIESIEVVSGVASAEYGELTDGAVIINRQAGKSQYQFSTRVNGGSSDFSLSKGYRLGKKSGAVNVNLGYLISNQDPRDNVKSYQRLSTGIMWTNQFGQRIKNTLSFNYSTRLDKVKHDPDDDSRRMTYAESRSLSINNRMSLTIKNSFLNKVNVSFNYSNGYQETYNQWLLNGPPKGLANKDTTGVYEGVFLPGAYLAEERIVGKPLNLGVNAGANGVFHTGRIPHAYSFGYSLSGAYNKGEGIIVDPNRPRWVNISNQNERPYNFRSVPEMLNHGFYIQDNFSTRIFNGKMGGGVGVRYDIQGGMGNLQPRINLKYSIGKDWDINTAFGIATKSPTLAHRSPAPAWLDIPLLNIYTGYPDESLFLVYTQKIAFDNTNLKASRSTQLEAGLRYTGKNFSSSVFVFHKNNTNQFNSYNKFEPLLLPEYHYTFVPGEKITYYPTGNNNIYANTSNYIITNGLSSTSTGLEWMLSTEKIKVLQTSFNLATSYSLSRYDEGADKRVIMVDPSYIDQGKPAWYGVYRPLKNKTMAFSTKATSNTHIPELGFVVSFVVDFFWIRKIETLGSNNEPLGYIDKDFQYHQIEKFDPSNPDYGYLKLDPEMEMVNGVFVPKAGGSVQPYYSNIHLRISKEIKKQLRLAISAYNVFNLEPGVYNYIDNTYSSFNRPMSVSAGATLKF